MDSATLIKNYQQIDNKPMPASGFFVNDDTVQLNFGYANHLLGRRESCVSYVNLSSQKYPQIPFHNDSEKLVAYSADGKTKAIIRTTPFSPQMPVGTPKVGDPGSVVFLEVFKDSELVSNEILNDENGDFQTHPTITPGLVISPDSRYVGWVSATKKRNARKSQLGYKIKTFDFRDYGEDIDGVYGTNVVIFDTLTNKTHVVGAPSKHGACKFCFASENVIVLQAIDLSSPRLEGIRSYENRHFHLFAANISDFEKIEFKPLFVDKIYHHPNSFRIDEKTARIFCGRFVDDFGGHNGSCHFASFNLNLENLTASDYKESTEVYSIGSVPLRPFVNKDTVIVTIERRCLILPVSVNLNSFEVTDLIKNELNNSSIFVDDQRNGKYLIRISTTIETPRFAILSTDGSIENLSESTKFNELETTIIKNENYNDAILILAPGEVKRFIVSPHGGPHGMFSTYFNRNYTFLALCGYSIAMINFRGSTGYPIDVQRSLPGNCGKNDVSDVVEIINQVKAKYNVEKLGIYGYSHGGFLATHMAGQHPELLDFSVAGGPVTNLVASYYTCDIPDWALYESGVRKDCNGEYEMDEDAFHKMWEASSVRFAKNAKVPVLLAHGKIDRRVDMTQSVDYYLAMKRNGNPVKMIIYEMNGHSMKLTSCYDDLMANIVEFANDPIKYINKDDDELYAENEK
ncbi:Clan SC, family S9, acylaminoacyl-peptidase-like serine peptidase [Tritrichomonas foetus]|uniref:Clan SC, family S9, acylaminoacyl-peptidase-like serine peptidase n=1 Tax=Tritrichomonas foetus TaxID=1144522 RepID=A0A1J4KFL8_9EUKA|nr:Clan SC, family S9, acylaminoacyl-peptidase-like serine peptidase [Tritrichomonas foetus]|eukprot:OHT09736.1 Clan SC, family S9, acylaminoacyl-peptidase-like serine peptidase [Tritrichomonas foetus]